MEPLSHPCSEEREPADAVFQSTFRQTWENELAPQKDTKERSTSGTASDQHSIQQGDEAGAARQLLLRAMSGRQRLSLLSPDFTPTMRKPWWSMQ